MPFVTRDSDGRIVAVYEEAADPSREALPDDDPELLAWQELQRRQAAALTRLSASDAETVRVIEDLIDVLVDRKLILLTDLPAAAQAKLLGRQRTRQSLGSLDNLMVDEQDVL